MQCTAHAERLGGGEVFARPVSATSATYLVTLSEYEYEYEYEYEDVHEYEYEYEYEYEWE